jgi:hypothetical protein
LTETESQKAARLKWWDRRHEVFATPDEAFFVGFLDGVQWLFDQAGESSNATGDGEIVCHILRTFVLGVGR